MTPSWLAIRQNHNLLKITQPFFGPGSKISDLRTRVIAGFPVANDCITLANGWSFDEVTHFVPLCGDHGIPQVRAAGLLMLIGVFDIAGTTLSRWLTDRMNPRTLLAAVYGLRAVALSFLPTAFGIETWGLPLFAVIYGLDWIATLPPTLKLVNEEFGTQKGGVVFDWLFAIHQVGSGLTAFGAGETRTLVGDYGAALMVAVAICAAASIMFLILRTGSKRFPAERMA